MDTKKTTNKFSAEFRERAVRMVRDHQSDHASQWAAIAACNMCRSNTRSA